MSEGTRMRRRPEGVERSGDPPPRIDAFDDGAREVLDVLHALIMELSALARSFLKNLGLKDVKNWSEFFARFKPPKEWTLNVLDQRMTTNFLTYRGNYSMIAAGFLILGILFNLKTLLALACCALLLVFLFPTGDNPRVVKLGGQELVQSKRIGVAAIGVVLILSLSKAWYVLLFYGGTGVFLCVVHAIFRPRTMRSKANRLAEDVKASGGFTIEGAQTLVERAFNITPTTNSQ